MFQLWWCTRQPCSLYCSPHPFLLLLLHGWGVIKLCGTGSSLHCWVINKNYSGTELFRSFGVISIILYLPLPLSATPIGVAANNAYHRLQNKLHCINLKHELWTSTLYNTVHERIHIKSMLQNLFNKILFQSHYWDLENPCLKSHNGLGINWSCSTLIEDCYSKVWDGFDYILPTDETTQSEIKVFSKYPTRLLVIVYFSNRSFPLCPKCCAPSYLVHPTGAAWSQYSSPCLSVCPACLHSHWPPPPRTRGTEDL